MSAKKRKNTEILDVVNECKNCNTSFKGNYCPNCGQSTKEFNRPFSILIYDFMGTMFAFDTRLLKTLKSLIISPGRYSSEFVEGKRASYMQPFKFYVFVSFVFFLLLHIKTGEFISANSDQMNPNRIMAPVSVKDTTALADTSDIVLNKKTAKEDSARLASQIVNSIPIGKIVGKNGLDTNEIKKLKSALMTATDPAAADSLARELRKKLKQAAANEWAVAGKGKKKLNKTERDKIFTDKNIKKVQALLIKEYNKPKKSPFQKRILANTIRLMDYPDVFVSRTLQYFSYSLFILVPFFALWLWLFFHKTRKFYFSHLVYSLASLSTAFMIISVVIAIKLIFPHKLSAPENYLLWLIPIYIWWGLKRFYKRRIVGTTFRFLVLSMIYGFSTLFAAIIVFFLSIYF